LFHRVVEPKRPDAAEDSEHQIIDRLDETDVYDGMSDEGKKAKDKENSCKKNRNSNDDLDGFIFPVFSIDVVFFDESEFLYTSSPIPDFIIT